MRRRPVRQIKPTDILEAGTKVQHMETNETVTVRQTGPAADVIREGETVDPNEWVELLYPGG